MGTLEIILYTTLHKLNGLNAEIFCGDATFGIRHIKVSLRVQGNIPEFKVSDSEDVEPTTEPMLSQNSPTYPVFYPVRNLGSFIPVLVLKKAAISVVNKHYLDFVTHLFHLSG